MPSHRGTETDFELTTIERLEAQGYTHLLGLELERPHDDVVLRDVLRANLAKRYRDLPPAALDEAVKRIARPEGVDTIHRNRAVHRLLTKGMELPVEHPDGRRETVYVWPIDWGNVRANDFHVVNQLPVRGQNDRRPDALIYVNGLPLALFELKNSWSAAPTVEEAWNQIQHYTHDIAQLFEYNAVCVASDGVHTLHGVWSAAGHFTTKAQRDAIKERMKDVSDPLALAIVVDMWLTGTDIPCLHTLYVDKPMRGHTIIQAISRVNRVFRDKPHGLVVDYIGIGDDLREATDRYTRGGGRGEPAPEVGEEARPIFLAALDDVRELLPAGHDDGSWRRLTRIALEDLYALVYGTLAEDDERRDRFLDGEHLLTNAFLLVKHLDDCRAYADEVIFCRRVRKQLLKALPGRRPDRDVERAVRDLVDDSVESAGVVDIFRAAGIHLADISILDENFLQTLKEQPHENLRLKLLEKLVRDELDRRRPHNVARDRSFRALLETTLQKYHNRLLDAAAVVKAMLEIRRELEADARRAEELGLEPEELAFYDAVAANRESVYEPGFLRDLVHDVVQTLKARLKVDWTQPHRDAVKAEVRSAVRRVLYRRDVREEDLEPLLQAVMRQAEALYADWPQAA